MNAIITSGCSVICFQETKKSNFDLSFIKSCCLEKFDDYAFIPSNGASGELLILCDSSVFSGMVMHCDSFAISLHFTSTQSPQAWTLVNVYSPYHGDKRNDFVHWLYGLNIPDNEDWLLVGDFNFIRSPNNRNKPGGNINDMFIFNDIIREQNLTELPIKGRRYTWSNMQDDPLLEQLDWFFLPPCIG
jgi:hypothetical protein